MKASWISTPFALQRMSCASGCLAACSSRVHCVSPPQRALEGCTRTPTRGVYGIRLCGQVTMSGRLSKAYGILWNLTPHTSGDASNGLQWIRVAGTLSTRFVRPHPDFRIVESGSLPSTVGDRCRPCSGHIEASRSTEPRHRCRQGTGVGIDGQPTRKRPIPSTRAAKRSSCLWTSLLARTGLRRSLPLVLPPDDAACE